MSERLNKWLHHPARWYEFWYPQSGFFGGVVLICVILLLVYLLILLEA